MSNKMKAPPSLPPTPKIGNHPIIHLTAISLPRMPDCQKKLQTTVTLLINEDI